MVALAYFGLELIGFVQCQFVLESVSCLVQVWIIILSQILAMVNNYEIYQRFSGINFRKRKDYSGYPFWKTIYKTTLTKLLK